MIGIKRGKSNLKIALLLLMIIISAVSYVYIEYGHRPKNQPNPSKTTQSKPKKAVFSPNKVSSKMLFTGNVFWGRYIRDWSLQSELKYAYPFSRLNEFKRDQYDAWIGGIECPISAKVNMTSAEQEAQLQFNCRPEFLPEAAKFFDVFTLANNHTDNQGPDGFEETKQHLQQNKIQYFGHYDYRATDEACKVIALPAQYQQNSQVKQGYLPVAMCGFHGVFGIPTEDSIAQIKRYQPYLPVFALPHMGAEYKASPDDIKTGVYHNIIDAGADVVLADHPHWIQNTEAYKGKLIVYSMGNFMFDQQRTVEVTRSAAIEVNLLVEGKNLQKWFELGQKCYQSNGECLDEIVQANLKKLDYEMVFDAIGTNDQNKITKPATPAQNEAIMQRLRWNQTIKNLKAPYSAIGG